MSNSNLAIYLNDHLSGSVVALQMLERLLKEHMNPELGCFLHRLDAEIKADRKALETILSQLNIEQSTPRKAAAWITEKALRLKLWVDDPTKGELGLFESLEALSMGIEGKRLLWLALSQTFSEGDLRGLDLKVLIQKAEQQRQDLEMHRLDAARNALLPSPAKMK